MPAWPRLAEERGAGALPYRVEAKRGMLLLWESWLRHGVESNRANGPRISISFNYA